jgi:hypothetical protein
MESLEHRVTSLERNAVEMRGDMKGLRDELVSQGKALAKIETGIERLVAALVLIPPREVCVRAEMRIAALEENVVSLEENQGCIDCKNGQHVADLILFKKEWEPKLWKGIGGLVVIQLFTGVIFAYIAKKVLS